MDGEPNEPNEPRENTLRPRHERVFAEIIPGGLQSTEDCQICHADVAAQLLSTGHWNWRGVASNIAGFEDGLHGKRDLINAFYLTVASNEARCSQCHISFGWRDASFDFGDPARIDCLICHDTTGTYAKVATAGGGGGGAALRIDGRVRPADPAELTPVAQAVGRPSRANCGACHFYAEGGDNVMTGDLPSDLADPPDALDVHMGRLDFSCQTCHTEMKHGIAGFQLHSVGEGGAGPQCVRCHGESDAHRDNQFLAPLLNLHTRRVACETCHIPALARSRPTLIGLYWSEAGRDISPVPTDRFGMPTFDRRRGRLVWDMNFRPELRWHNGRWRRAIVGAADTFTATGTAEDPVVLAEPTASIADPQAKIYPFKRFEGDQPADRVERRLLAAHLFGEAAGPNAFWERFDWNLSLAEGTAVAGQPYSGEHEFVRTRTYLKVSHTVAPREQALRCEHCHGIAGFFEALGYERDPFEDF